MSRKFISLLLIVALAFAVSCTTSDAEAVTQAIEEPVAAQAAAVQVEQPAEEGKKYIPVQSGLEEGIEYQLLGTMGTPIGDAKVTCNLAEDGTYECSMLIGPYTSSASWGTWEFDVESDAFIFTDTDNGLNLTSTKEGDTYTVVVPFREGSITVSAEITEKKEYTAPMIPVQSGLEEGIEYQLLGTMGTPIGDAKVTCNLAEDGTYECSMLIGPYTSSASWGTWEFDVESDAFIFTDTDNGLNLTSTKEGDTYTVVVPFREGSITVSAEITEKKAYAAPMAPAQSGLEAGIEYQLLGTMGTPIGDATVTCNLAENGTYECSMLIGPYTSSASWGTWEYDIKNDAFILTDTDNGLSLTSTKEGDTYTVVVPFREGSITVSAEMTEKKAYKAKTQAAAVAEETVKAERLGVEIEHIEYTPIEDRYSGYDQAKWDELWREDSYEVQPYDKKDYGASKYDSLFEQTLSMDDYKLVAKDQRGTIDKVYYDTTLYSFYMANGVAEEEWVPNRKYCYVYLPAGYDETKQYNVFYLMHGAGGSQENWFGMNFTDGQTINAGDFLAVVDYLIASGKMEPTIFVSATITTDMSNYSKAVQNRYTTTDEVMNFGYELKYDLIPAIEGTYSTYAEGTDVESLKASKKHRAFGGLSMGANVTWNAIPSAYDVIGYFAPLANGAAMGDDQAGRAAEMLEELNGADLSDIFIFSSAGTKDHCYEPQYSLEQVLLETSNGQFAYGENIIDFVPENGTHTAKYFILGAVNAMKVFFK